MIWKQQLLKNELCIWQMFLKIEIPREQHLVTSLHCSQGSSFINKTILDYSSRSILFVCLDWGRVRSELLDLRLQFAGFRNIELVSRWKKV